MSEIIEYQVPVVSIRTLEQWKDILSAKLYKKSGIYVLYEGKLYKRSYSLPLLRCLRPSETDFALWKVYEKIYESHVGTRFLSQRLLR